MNNGTEKYIETVAYLGKLYDFCNEKFFNGKLKKPVITIQRDERKRDFRLVVGRKSLERSFGRRRRTRVKHNGTTIKPPYRSDCGNAYSRNVPPIRCGKRSSRLFSRRNVSQQTVSQNCGNARVIRKAITANRLVAYGTYERKRKTYKQFRCGKSADDNLSVTGL